MEQSPLIVFREAGLLIFSLGDGLFLAQVTHQRLASAHKAIRHSMKNSKLYLTQFVPRWCFYLSGAGPAWVVNRLDTTGVTIRLVAIWS